jgi:hypothetical protein
MLIQSYNFVISSACHILKPLFCFLFGWYCIFGVIRFVLRILTFTALSVFFLAPCFSEFLMLSFDEEIRCYHLQYLLFFLRQVFVSCSHDKCFQY